jgi:hypothetical protein
MKFELDLYVMSLTYNSQPIPYVIVRRSSLSIKPYVHVRPSFSYIMSSRDVHVYIDDTSCTKWIFGWKQDLAEQVKQASPN